MRFRVLGAVEVRDADGTWHAVGSPSQRRVLAALVAHAGTAVSLDTLVEAVWGDQPPESAVPALRTYLSRLRPLLGADLVAAGAGYRLDAAPDDIDAGCFGSLARAAESSSPEEALRSLDEALGLWRGSAYGAEADVPCVRAEARRLEQQRAVVAEARLAALLGCGQLGEAVGAAEALLTVDPLREGAWLVLVEALARAGRTADALRAAHRAGEALAEAGLVVPVALREAERAVLEGTVGPHRPAVPRAAPGRALPPLPVSSFVGRDHDRDQVVALLERARVVTLVGPGGVGKTRLALEVARRAAARRELGGALVELAAVTDDDAVAAAIRTAAGLAADEGGEALALARAGDLDLLVVLDNAEHVVEATAQAVSALVGGGDRVRVLVTSRERLGIDGEHVWTVAPLATVGADGPAGQLFVDRARATAPDLVLAADDAEVQRIVRRLDGLPLAIEMAAAQLASTSPTELVALLDEHLDALRSARRDVADRHRSLADVLAWSEARLSERESATLAGMAVFAGPVAAADVAEVLGDDEAPTLVRTLAERSLVAMDRSTTPTRFHLLETVRSFAAVRLAAAGRDEALASRHARWCVAVARDADALLRTEEERRAHDRFGAVYAELRAAHRWARRHDPDVAADLSVHVHLWASTRLLDEPLGWAEELLGVLPGTHPAVPVLLGSAANRALIVGDLARARRLAETGIEVAGDDERALPALEAASDCAVYDGRLHDGAVACRELVRLATRAGDPYYLVMGHVGLVMDEAYLGHDPGPGDPFAGLDPTGLGPTGRAWLAYVRGEVLLDRDPDAAFAHLAEAVALARSVGHRMVEGVSLVSICSLRARVGDLDAALRTFREVITHWLGLADRTHQLTTLRNLVALLERAGAAEATAELLGAVARDDIPTYGEEADRLRASAAWATAVLGPDRYSAALAAGAALDIPEAAHRALEIIDGLEPARG